MIPAFKPKNVYPWRFFRAGGFDQVKLETGADLMNLDKLDQKLWVALACPTTGVEFDPQTLALIDADKDGRIRAPELIAAIKWAGSMLKNPDDIVKAGDFLAFDAFNDATPEGKQLLASAKQIAQNLGRADAKGISLDDASDANKIFSNTTFNGDGVIIPESASDDATKSVINDIGALFGTLVDRSGKAGIDQAKVDGFFAECVAFDAWTKETEADPSILPAGPATAAASAAVQAIKAKVNDYFGRCRLAAFDARTLTLLNRKEEEYLAIAANDLSITAAEVADFPLAVVAPGKPLPLVTGINPAHAAAIATLHASAIKPLLGEKSELTEADWLALQAKLAAFETWNAMKGGSAVEKLGIARVREILAGKACENINALIAKDKALEQESNAITSVEKLARYVRDLHHLCINFVNFKDFYDNDDHPAIFQMGTLYLDQRSCTLTLPVDDAAKHASMAALAGSYLAYCDCVRKATSEKRQIVAAFTNGDSDNLMVGRNGLFYDRKGKDWDATITKIVDNPISIRQAFWAPYKKLVRMIEEQVAKRAAAADATATTKLTSAAATTTNLDKAKPEAKKMDVGTIAAISVAIAGIGALITSLLAYATGLFRLPFWQLCLAMAGLLLVISGPSMIIAWLKLRKRNLGPILDANGWAVNAKARLNVPFGASLTGVAELPPGAKITTDDRFSERPSVWPKLALAVVILCFIFSLMNQFCLLDLIAYKITGKHYPDLFKQSAQPATSTTTTTGGGSTTTTTVSTDGVSDSTTLTNQPPAK